MPGRNGTSKASASTSLDVHIRAARRQTASGQVTVTVGWSGESLKSTAPGVRPAHSADLEAGAFAIRVDEEGNGVLKLSVWADFSVGEAMASNAEVARRQQPTLLKEEGLLGVWADEGAWVEEALNRSPSCHLLNSVERKGERNLAQEVLGLLAPAIEYLGNENDMPVFAAVVSPIERKTRIRKRSNGSLEIDVGRSSELYDGMTPDYSPRSTKGVEDRLGAASCDPSCSRRTRHSAASVCAELEPVNVPGSRHLARSGHWIRRHPAHPLTATW
jgi:hypothetical protein